jgi:hypothetical protein
LKILDWRLEAMLDAKWCLRCRCSWMSLRRPLVLLQRLVPLDWLFLAHSEVAVGVCTIKIVVLSTDDCPVLARAYDGPMCRSSSAEACTTLLALAGCNSQPPRARFKAARTNAMSHHSTNILHNPDSQKHLGLQTASEWRYHGYKSIPPFSWYGSQHIRPRDRKPDD